MEVQTQKAILYVRVRSENQLAFKLQQSEEQLRSHCLDNNIDVVAVFMDTCSAANFERPGICSLLDFIEANKDAANLLLFTTWDRFSRNFFKGIEMERQLKALGVEPKAIVPVNSELMKILEVGAL